MSEISKCLEVSGCKTINILKSVGKWIVFLENEFMEKIPISNKIYDLVVVGNGIAAQTFLWNLSQEFINANKSQNFSIAHVYSEIMAPSCSLRSSATVSLNGIQEDVSSLGDELREGFFLFEQMVKKHNPDGVHLIERVVVATNEAEVKKIKRRYKELDNIGDVLIKGCYPGVRLPSYLIEPENLLKWLDQDTKLKKDNYNVFVKNLEKSEAGYVLTTEDKKEIKAKKIIFATGSFAKIFSGFFKLDIPQVFDPETNEEIPHTPFESRNTIKSGSFLEQEIELGDNPFFLTIDGHQVLYKPGKVLQLGSVTGLGAYEAPELAALMELFYHLKERLNFPIGEFRDFKIVTGLRHKGPRRLLQAHQYPEENIFWINGLYKNGYTLSALAAQRILKLLNLSFK
jgi:hypothetical protein